MLLALGARRRCCYPQGVRPSELRRLGDVSIRSKETLLLSTWSKTIWTTEAG